MPEIPDGPAMTLAERRKLFGGGRGPVVARGYAALPGSGPEGETCGSCRHHVENRRARAYHKCDLYPWTNGGATDIRLRSPACEKWEAKNANP